MEMRLQEVQSGCLCLRVRILPWKLVLKLRERGSLFKIRLHHAVICPHRITVTSKFLRALRAFTELFTEDVALSQYFVQLTLFSDSIE
jgi:hypothetical protein